MAATRMIPPCAGPADEPADMEAPKHPRTKTAHQVGDRREPRPHDRRRIRCMATRIEPVQPPYPPELQQVFDAIMPPGVPPLALFTTLARAPRVWDRFRAGSLLDRGPVSLRHREIVIDRTCARCGCGYEWGVHVALFAR